MEEKSKLWLYDNQYKQADNHPGKTGTGEIPIRVLKQFVEKAKAAGIKDDDSLKLRCASWERTSKNGNPYIFVTMEIDEKPKAAEPPSGSDDIPW